MRSVGENRDELPNCFLEHRRLDCPLPRAIHLRAQRPDHMAVTKTVLTDPLVNTPSAENFERLAVTDRRDDAGGTAGARALAGVKSAPRITI